MAWNRHPSRSSKDSWSPARVRWRRTISRSSRRSLLRRPISMVVSAISDPCLAFGVSAGRHTVAGSAARATMAARTFDLFGAVTVNTAPRDSQAANTSCW